MDWDSDGYESRGVIEWDANTDQDSLLIRVVIFGRDSLSNVTLLAVSAPYKIYEDEAELFFVQINAIYRSLWDFRLAIIDEFDDTLSVLGYGEWPIIPPGIPLDIPMEIIQEDAVFIKLAPPTDAPDVTGGPDSDNDGYDRDTDIYFKIQVVYDTTYLLYVDVYAQDADSNELYMGSSDFFPLSYLNNDILFFGFSPGFVGLHSEWDFRIEVHTAYCYDECLLSSIAYQQLTGLTNVPLERWNEDGPYNTVFQPNPIHSLNDPSLEDMDDEVEATPWGRYEGAYFIVDLDRLDPPSGGVYSLTGVHASVVDFPDDFGYPHTAPPTSSDGSFPFLRDQPGFEAVMAYYYVDASQQYISGLGFPVRSTPIEIDVHAFGHESPQDEYAGYGYDTISTPPGMGLLLFGDLDVDQAEDADIILHESAHAAVDLLSGGQMRGIGVVEYWDLTYATREGFSDYWAASWSDSFYPGGYDAAYVNEWGAPPARRYVNTNKDYPDNMIPQNPSGDDDPWLNGEIWSACLWTIMQEIGKSKTDSLALYAFQLTAPNEYDIFAPTFEEMAQLIVAADTLGYNAAHADFIMGVFRDRGILPCECPNQGDYDEDTFITALDLGILIDILFAGHPTVRDPYCPSPRGDFDLDGLPTSLDLSRLIDYLFANGFGPEDPCTG